MSYLSFQMYFVLFLLVCMVMGDAVDKAGVLDAWMAQVRNQETVKNWPKP